MQLLALLVSAIVIGSSDAITCYTSTCFTQSCGSGDVTLSGCASCQLATTVFSVGGISSTGYTRSCSMTALSNGCSTVPSTGASVTTCNCNTDNCNANQNTAQATTPASRNTAPLTATTAATAALLTLSTTLILSL